MGLLISRFRKKKSKEEQLEDLTQKIQEIEEFQESEEDKLRLRVRQLVIYSAIIYVFILCIYFILDPESGKKYLLLTIILLPIVIFLFRKLIIVYYQRKIVRNKMKIEVYKKEKKKILDDVMETETYKVAKRILEKYDIQHNSKKFTPPRVSTPIPIPKPTPGAVTPYQSSLINTDLRRRATRDTFFNQNNQLVSAQKAPPTLVRPIVTQNKGVFDRILQKVVGDGPNERYALICKRCGSHNGMALEEEFEFLSYRCAFCSYFNPARKQRVAMQNMLNLMAIKNESDSDSSYEKKPLEITELEDSESETKEDIPKTTVGDKKKDFIDKIVIAEKPSPPMNTEKESEPTAEIHNVKEDTEVITELKHQEKIREVAYAIEENVNNNPNKIDPKQNEVEITEVVAETSNKETEINTNEDSEQAIPEVSPMEVDEDENAGVELSSSVKKISLDS